MNPRYRFLMLLGIILLGSAIYYFATTDRSTDYVLIGTVDAYQIVVGPKILGRIEKLNVEDGTQVKAGDVIAVLDSDELRAEQLAMRASLSGARQRVGESSATLRLWQGQTASTVSQAEAQLANAQAQLQAVQANLQRAQQNYDRIIPLAQQGVASRQEADNATADLNQQKANVAAASKAVDAAKAQVATARAGTNQALAAREQLGQSRAQQQNTQAQLEQANTRLGYTNVVAPVDGIVTTRVAREGEVVNPGSPIVTIVDLNDTWVYADAPETMAVNIALGDTLRVRLPNRKIIEGKVTFKNAEADFATQRDVGGTKRDIKSIALKIAVDNHDHTLAPGMTAEVLIPKNKLGSKR